MRRRIEPSSGLLRSPQSETRSRRSRRGQSQSAPRRRAAGASGRGSSSTGANRSPCRATRSSATGIPKSLGRRPDRAPPIAAVWTRARRASGAPSRPTRSSCPSRSGGGRRARPPLLLQPLRRHVARDGAPRAAARPRSANAYVCSNVDRRVIGATTWMPSAPLVFTYPGSSTSSSSSRIRCATSIASSKPPSPADRGRRGRSPAGRACRRANTTRSCRCSSSAPSRAPPRGEFDEREVDQPRIRPRADAFVNRRVAIHAGIPFGACFWKNTSPAIPCGSASS